MRKVLLAAAVVVLGLSVAVNASAITKQAVRSDVQSAPYGLSVDCTLCASNICAGWIWVFNELQGGAVWGCVFDPNDCPGGCENGGAVSEIQLYSRCSVVPGCLADVGLSLVNAVDCPTTALYGTGPVTVTHCVAGDRWTTFPVPLIHMDGQRFAVTITWCDPVAGASNPQLATDNGIGNLFCSMGVCCTFPGCASTGLTCVGWTNPPQKTFIYVTDFNGDTVLDDICGLYGVPYSLAFPYMYPYGYLSNNLVVCVGLDCLHPTAVEPSSWGHVKALYE
jgi:hypothetical protein